MTQQHIPVLLSEVMKHLSCEKAGVYVDGTFGAGGYTRAILQANPCNKVFAFDRDPLAQKFASDVQAEFGERFVFIPDCFSTVRSYVSEQADGFVLDLGVSSMQIDQADRGFSFRFDGPLDMRMSQDGMSAETYINSASEKELADVLFQYGEEKASRRIARAIVAERVKNPIVSTKQLADLIHRVMPKPKDGSDSAMRTFQALRIRINDELGELETALEASIALLKPKGRLAVVTFHSLEDRLVKNFLIRHSAFRPNVNRHALPDCVNPTDESEFEIVTRRPVVPTEEELARNSRAHSAKLRCGIRTEAGQ